MLAAVNGQVGAVKALLAHHANPNIADASGATPLRAANSNGQSRIVVILRQAGAR
jgi:ankyrin repeat protein